MSLYILGCFVAAIFLVPLLYGLFLLLEKTGLFDEQHP